MFVDEITILCTFTDSQNYSPHLHYRMGATIPPLAKKDSCQVIIKYCYHFVFLWIMSFLNYYLIILFSCVLRLKTLKWSWTIFAAVFLLIPSRCALWLAGWLPLWSSSYISFPSRAWASCTLWERGEWNRFVYTDSFYNHPSTGGLHLFQGLFGCSKA